MQTVVQCKQCGKTYSAGVVNNEFGGLCPSCVAAFALEELKQSPLEPPPDTDRTTIYLKPGTEFQGLEIVSVLGQGGMGVVYKAKQKGLDRFVAVKVMSDRLAGDAEFVKRFQKEARAMAALSHPNIVAVYNYGIDNNRCFIVMEYVDGVTLRGVLREKKLTADEALRIVPQLCDALEYAHGEGVVHRDIKPENILMDRKGRVKIADFGLAKMVAPDRADHTMTGLVMGTPHYMAPEQVETPRDVDHRADIYSMGVVFYELLTGELPIGRFALPSQRGVMDSRLDHVVLRALEKARDRRYQHASEFKTDVSRVSEFIPMARLADPAAAARGVGVHVASPASPKGGFTITAAMASEPHRGMSLDHPRMSHWVGAGFGLTIAALVMGVVTLILAGVTTSSGGRAGTGLIYVVFGGGTIFGSIGFLCAVIGVFEILFSGGRLRGYGLAFLTFAMNLIWVVMGLVAFLTAQAPAPHSGELRQPVAPLFESPQTAQGPVNLLEDHVATPRGLREDSATSWAGESRMADFWRMNGIAEGAADVVQARQVLYLPSGTDRPVIRCTILAFRKGASQESARRLFGNQDRWLSSGDTLVIISVQGPGQIRDKSVLDALANAYRTGLGGNVVEGR